MLCLLANGKIGFPRPGVIDVLCEMASLDYGRLSDISTTDTFISVLDQAKVA